VCPFCVLREPLSAWTGWLVGSFLYLLPNADEADNRADEGDYSEGQCALRAVAKGIESAAALVAISSDIIISGIAPRTYGPHLPNKETYVSKDQ
jgi:hypothetical protein